MKNVLDNIKVLENLENVFTDKKSRFLSQINREDNNKFSYDAIDISEEFSNFFEDAVRFMNIKLDKSYLDDTQKNMSDPIKVAIKKLETI